MSTTPREAAMMAHVTIVRSEIEKAHAAVKAAQACVQAGNFDQGARSLLSASEPVHDADTLLRAFNVIEASPID